MELFVEGRLSDPEIESGLRDLTDSGITVIALQTEFGLKLKFWFEGLTIDQCKALIAQCGFAASTAMKPQFARTDYLFTEEDQLILAMSATNCSRSDLLDKLENPVDTDCDVFQLWFKYLELAIPIAIYHAIKYCRENKDIGKAKMKAMVFKHVIGSHADLNTAFNPTVQAFFDSLFKVNMAVVFPNDLDYK